MITKCANPNCNGIGSFELNLLVPKHANYKLWFVQCSLCGTPVSTMEYLNAGVLLDGLEKSAKNLSDKLDHVLNELYSIGDVLSRMARK